jgi:hypothetical protein
LLLEGWAPQIPCLGNIWPQATPVHDFMLVALYEIWDANICWTSGFIPEFCWTRVFVLPVTHDWSFSDIFHSSLWVTDNGVFRAFVLMPCFCIVCLFVFAFCLFVCERVFFVFFTILFLLLSILLSYKQVIEFVTKQWVQWLACHYIVWKKSSD